MERYANRVERAATNSWLVLASMLLSIGGGLYALFTAAFRTAQVGGAIFWGAVLLAVCSGTYFAVGIYTFQRKLRGLKVLAEKLHEINHAYRDCLARTVFHSSEKTFGEYMKNEREVLAAVCQKIAAIFRALTATECVVTVLLCTNSEDKGKEGAFAFVRSENGIPRDAHGPSVFTIEKNTAFMESRRPHSSDISRFYSPDLIKRKVEGNYNNERENWEIYYKSSIVVPIRFAPNRDCTNSHDLGYLAVDTKARHRLNDTTDVQLLAAFADQMFNFLNLRKAQLLNSVVSNNQHNAPCLTEQVAPRYPAAPQSTVEQMKATSSGSTS